MHAGTVLACDTPQRLMETRQTDDLEVAFISYIAEAEGELETARQQANLAADDHASRELAAESVQGIGATGRPPGKSRVSLNRMLAYSRRERWKSCVIPYVWRLRSSGPPCLCLSSVWEFPWTSKTFRSRRWMGMTPRESCLYRPI